MILTWFARLVGARLALPAFIAVCLALLAGLAWLAWPKDRTAEAQAIQTTKSGEAIANAAAEAVNTVAERGAAEKAVDNTVTAIQEKITHAQSPDAVRNAVLDGLCQQQAYRDDPACKVRRSGAGGVVAGR